LPGSPPSSPIEEKEILLVPKHSHHPSTIAEEQLDQDEGIVMNKSSLSLPFEQSPTSPSAVTANATANNNSSGTHVKVSLPERSQSDRRKLSVTNIMSFGERRRSTSSIFSDMRKMSITNFDNLKSPGVGEIMFSFTILSSSPPYYYVSDLAQSIFY
jgi:hypothetical protein